MIGRAGGFPLDNRGTDYELPLGRETRLNRRVYRFSANPAAARYLDSHANLNGRIQDPLVLLSNEYDDMIPVRLNALYPNLVRAAGRQRWVLQMPPRGRGHCHFTGDQIGQAFDKLIAMRRR